MRKTASEALWGSALVAALFALHPLHVESVTWVAERKDVLSTLFLLLTMLAYARYVQQPKVQSPKSKVAYHWRWCGLPAGLMSKPMLVTLPFVLLLLDYWPLNRLQSPECGMRNWGSPGPPLRRGVGPGCWRRKPPSSRWPPLRA